MKVFLWESDLYPTLFVDSQPSPKDETVEIPETLFNRWSLSLKAFQDVQSEIREFQREQERRDKFRDLEEDKGIRVLRYKD